MLGTYLARWSPSDLPKPTGREPARVADWVEAVFVRKRFYAEPDIGSGRVRFFYLGREREVEKERVEFPSSFFGAFGFCLPA